jgi:type I restriction enzyme, S subunit
MQGGIPQVAIGESSIHVSDGNYSSKYPKAHEFLPSGIPFVSANNLRDGRIIRGNLKFISEELHASLKKGHVCTGDVLLVTRGSLGMTALVTGEFDDANINAQLVLLRADNKTVDARYLFFVTNSPDFQSQVASNATGTAQPQLPIAPLKRLTIPLPPIPVQRRIAGILSAYDELIENSQRRIRILEAMARALYREWFVYFRFPGHERLPRVTSPLGEIPQGWEARRLDAVCRSVQDGDWIETKDQGGEDYRLVQISNIGVGEFIETGNLRFVTQETFDRIRCTEILPGDILVARMPTPIGRAWLATPMPWRMITAVDVAIIRTRTEVLPPLFLGLAWNEAANLQRIAAQASGTTRPRVTRRELVALEFVIPPIDHQLRFVKLVEPTMEMIQALRSQIQNLRRTRDLLLPRLLSGQQPLKPLDP